ncbi:MAG: metallophosphoesterase [Gemmataceae bacterium]|nr:metallophosphoesterase [Gemmataceae bacterium]
MKHLLLGLCTVAVVGAALAWSTPKPEFDFQREERNPVTSLKLNNDPGAFQFAIVSDRTGGHRAQIFAQAVERLNLLQPEFVVSVGDLIEGYTEDRARLAREWREFQGYVARLQMPFFYVPGNHDLSNLAMDRLWQEKFGRRYYDFVYRDVLFLMLNSEDPPGKEDGAISAEQLAFIQKSLEAHRDARWTLVFLHKPMWAFGDAGKSGWQAVEKLLSGRPHTVFAGHVHRYQKFVRNGGQRYYMLATTGGGSKLRGSDYGEFDHIVWVTMKNEGPVLANLTLDGILPEDLRPVETAEQGAPQYYRRPTHPVTCRVTLEGQPVPQAYVVWQAVQTKEPGAPRADGFTGADGAVTLSTYMAHDGVPAGEYVVTVEQRKPLYDEAGKPGPNHLPAVYARRNTTPLRAAIKSGTNTIELNLKGQ